MISSNEIAPGRMRSVDLHGVAVAIANVDGAFYGIGDACSHAGCSLSDGSLEGSVVTCLNDGSQFDLASGHVLTGPATLRVRTYRVQVHGTELRI